MDRTRLHRTRISRSSLRGVAAALALAIMFVLTLDKAPTAQAQTYSVVHNFTGGADGAYPWAGLTMDSAGSLYGTATSGGVANGGSVFKLTHGERGWLFTPLYDFTSDNDGGVNPGSRVIFGPDGTLYGTTISGGGFCDIDGLALRHGFQPATACKCATLHTRELDRDCASSLQKDGGDGNYPIYGDIAFDQAGVLYGTTALGGTYGNCNNEGCGTAYKLAHSSDGWSESVIWDFGHGPDGSGPLGGVTLDSSGNLYGTTNSGGGLGGGGGTAFQLKPSGSGWAMNVLHSFHNQADGASPHAGLIFDGSGNLYGASSDGGVNGGGVVFELTPHGSTWVFSVLYSLPGTPGYQTGPAANLFMDSHGNLYGTTRGSVGVLDWGTVFRLTPSPEGWTYTLLYRFSGGSDGAYPKSNLVSGYDGNLYGTTSQGGAYDFGVIFKIAQP